MQHCLTTGIKVFVILKKVDVFLHKGSSHAHSLAQTQYYYHTCFADIYDFKANVFSLSVAVSPDD